MKAGELQKKMKEKMHQEETLMKSESIEQTRLTSNLKKELNGALNIMKNDILDQNRQLTQLLKESLLESEKVVLKQKSMIKKQTLLPILVTMTLLITVILGSWGITFYLSKKINSQLIEIEKNNLNLKNLEMKGGTIKVQTCHNQPCVQIDITKPVYEQDYMIIKR